MRFVFAALTKDLSAAWRRHCGDYGFVDVYDGSILEVDVDALVSPANSFGFMDGGIDRHYLDHFGWGLQARVQRMIRERHHGEMLVGTADIVATGDSRQPYLIVAPTMRTPQVLRNSVNAYLAMRAILLLLRQGEVRDGPGAGRPLVDVVRRVAVPGLGTGVGEMSPADCARQVRAAIESTWIGAESFPSSWIQAQERQERLLRE